MATGKIRKLGDDRMAIFATETFQDAIWKSLWESIRSHLAEKFPDGEFEFLDIGGGDGLFADTVLEAFPKSRGTVVDDSEYMVQRNREDDRKRVLCGSVETIAAQFGSEQFDVIFLNYLLHHLVGDTYHASRHNIAEALGTVQSLLKAQGAISVCEIMCDGRIFDGLPSHLIYHLTSSKVLSRLVSRAGAHTAGVGVCFLSKKRWLSLLADSGLRVTGYADGNERRIGRLQKALLHLGYFRVAHLWCEPDG